MLIFANKPTTCRYFGLKLERSKDGENIALNRLSSLIKREGGFILRNNTSLVQNRECEYCFEEVGPFLFG